MALFRYYNHPLLRELAFLLPPLYGWRASTFRAAIEIARRFLPDGTIKAADLGTGIGLFAGQLLRHFPNIRVDAVDVNPHMTAIAKRRLLPDRRVRVITSDVMDLTGPYDAIFALYLLVLVPLEPTLEHLTSILNENGIIVFNLTSPTPAMKLHRKFYSIFEGSAVNLYPSSEGVKIASCIGEIICIKQVEPIEGSYVIAMRRRR